MARAKQSVAPVTPPDQPMASRPPGRDKPLVFISHDTRDADIAEAFANLLQDASGGVLRSFRSSDRKGTSGIEFGAAWYSAIMDRLKDATDVVALLTAQSIGRPWLLYEAGVAKGRLDTVVFGIALGVPLEQVGIGPFAQFQNSSDDEDSLTKLVLQLIRRNPDAEPREEAVRRQVAVFRAASADLLKKRPQANAPSAPSSPELNTSAVAKLFEEVKVMFRQLPDQLERSIERRLSSATVRTKSPYPDALFVRRLVARLSDTGMSDATPWTDLANVLYPISPRAGKAARAVRDAWNLRDEAQVRHRLIRLLEVFDSTEWEHGLEASSDEEKETFRNLPAMLSFVSGAIQGNFRHQARTPNEAIADATKGDGISK